MQLADNLKMQIRLEEGRALAQERGGRLLAVSLADPAVKVTWECTRGHRWEAGFRSVKNGTWCPTCSKRIPSIEDMRRVAAERGGKCLSPAYVNERTPLAWQCAKRHIWSTIPPLIRRGCWCPHCAKTPKLELKELRRIARLRGGKLLSRYYFNANSPLWWACGNGHLWKAAAHQVKGGKYRVGTWCRVCAIRARRGRPLHFVTIEEMKDIARQRGGECLSDIYVNSKTKLRFRCAKGHEWRTLPPSVKSGTWCGRCGRREIELEEVLRVVAQRQGRLISPSEEYVNGSSVVLMECAQGHRWWASGNQARKGRWCPQCARNRQGTLEEMRALARERGGECLSKRYVNSTTPLRWRCANGHVWMAGPDRLKAYSYSKRGAWCAVCFHESRKSSIAVMQELARARGGECLSKRYVNGQTPLVWRCGAGHVWKAIPHHIVLGHWCRKCAYKARRLTMGQVQDFARSYGGECLSKSYTNNDTPMSWRCAKGHIWRQPLNFVKMRVLRKRSWCAVCPRACECCSRPRPTSATSSPPSNGAPSPTRVGWNSLAKPL